MKPKYLLLFSAVLLNVTFLSAQVADSAASKKHCRFYVEALAGIDYMNFIYDKVKLAEKHVNLYWGQSNTNYLKRPPTFKLALNYRINKHTSVFAGAKYDHFVTRLAYYGGFSNYSVAYPQYEILDYDVISKTDNIKAFTGVKFNVNDFYFSISYNLNTLIMQETKKGYHDYYDAYNRTYKHDFYDGTTPGVQQSCSGFSINIGYDFRINKKGQAIKLELEGDYIYRTVAVPGHSYGMNIFNPSVCIGYRF